jgi:hypothetical protein
MLLLGIGLMVWALSTFRYKNLLVRDGADKKMKTWLMSISVACIYIVLIVWSLSIKPSSFLLEFE